MIMIIRRILANVIDIVTFFMIFVGILQFIIPFFGEGILALVAMIILVIIVPIAVQYPFMIVGQTVGKAFFGLRIISINENRPLTFNILLHREVVAKIMSCYLICIPVIFGKIAPHEEMTETRVINAR